ncbi:MAG: hypothetical protein ACREA2_04025 [Blastocatellia bacterium]
MLHRQDLALRSNNAASPEAEALLSPSLLTSLTVTPISLYPAYVPTLAHRTACFITLASLVLLLLSSSACSNGNQQALEASRQKIDEEAAKGIRMEPTPQAGEGYGFYIDASRSMAGFGRKAGDRSSGYYKLLEVVGGLPQCHIFKYGTSDGRTGFSPVSMTRELFRADFYNLGHNRDEDLVQRLLGEEAIALSVLVSDGVYSVPKAGYPIPFVNALSEWLQRGRVLAIYVFRAPFDGELYDQNDRAIGRAVLDDRPFYAFVFSANEAELEKFDNKLSQRAVRPSQRFVFADNALSCQPKLELTVGQNSDVDAAEHLYDQIDAAAYYWLMFDAGLFKRADSAHISFRPPCKLNAEYPVSGLRYDLKLENVWWWNVESDKLLAGQWERAPDQVGMKDNKVAVSEETIALSLARNPQASHTLYQFAVDLSSRNRWQLKQEIIGLNGLNTEDDRDVNAARQTYGFSRLIDGLVETHLAQRLAKRSYPRIFITLQNK